MGQCRRRLIPTQMAPAPYASSMHTGNQCTVAVLRSAALHTQAYPASGMATIRKFSVCSCDGLRNGARPQISAIAAAAKQKRLAVGAAKVESIANESTSTASVVNNAFRNLAPAAASTTAAVRPA